MAAQAEVVGNRQVEGSNPSGPTISRFSGPMAVRDKVSAALRGHDGIDRLLFSMCRRLRIMASIYFDSAR